ncbi:MAG: methionine aminotransferase [Deltaproteobacteria bacterium]|nr:methionine aminotransferase [Deltaproteobacteria bacterium]
MPLRSKLPQVGVTIFTAMSQLAVQHGAFNLSQGFPDFDVPSALVTLVEKHMRAGHNQYAPMQGVALLRERIAEKVYELYDARVDPETDITVTSGATEALFAAITAVVHPGDAVIVFEPAYDAYVPVIELNGGRPIYQKMSFPGYRIDWNAVAEAAGKARLLVINSPHNPTGTILTAEDMAALRQIVRSSDLLIVSDEVYEHIVFDGRRHQSLLNDPELAERSFVISSFGKTYHATGWKIGYCIAPAALTREFRRIHQFLTFSTTTPIQMAYADFMEQKGIYGTLPAFYQEKRDTFLSLLKGSRFRPLGCHGTYFQLLDYSAISSAPDVAFARRLTAAHGVAAIPPSVFYHDGDDHKVLRFCFAKKDETLQKAAEILCRI